VMTIVARSTRALEVLADELNKSSNRVLPITMDISKWKSVESGVRAACVKKGPLAGVVHCAGVIGPFGPISEVSVTEWKNAVDINLIGSFHLAKAVSGKFRKENSTFIAVSGGGATKPLPYVTSYASSKTGLIRLIESIALEQEFSTVSCVALAPGLMRTQMRQQILDQVPARVGSEFHESMQAGTLQGNGSLERSVELIARLIQHPEMRLSGKFISSVWDTWEKWIDGDFGNLEASANFTLRRMTHEA